MTQTFEWIDQAHPWFFSGLSCLLGAIVGSFLNVCIYRIPEERSVVTPGSACACGQPIPWYHNIPVLSWLLLRGRAACCGAPFSVRYPLVELLTAGLFLWIWLLYPPAAALAGMLFVALLICATFIDLDHMIIPDRFSIGGMVIGVLLSFAVPALHGVDGPPVARNIEAGIQAVTGALVGAGLVYWIAVLGEIVFRKPAMGEGDVKFVGCIGAFCGWQGAVFAMFGGAFVGSLVLLPLLLLSRIFGWTQRDRSPEPEVEPGENGNREQPERVQFGSQVPFGPMLAAAGLIYFLGFREVVDAYFSEFAVYFFRSQVLV